METKDVLKTIRKESKLSQSQFARKFNVTRQAVSRWENGLSTPNQETLKEISIYFNITINKLLGASKSLICQCCGMPLDDLIISKESDGTLNEKYCKWCYTDGKIIYQDLEELLEFLVPHLTEMYQKAPSKIKEQLKEALSRLEMWKDNLK